jgi:hypothetical protein
MVILATKHTRQPQCGHWQCQVAASLTLVTGVQLYGDAAHQRRRHAAVVTAGTLSVEALCQSTAAVIIATTGEPRKTDRDLLVVAGTACAGQLHARLYYATRHTSLP